MLNAIEADRRRWLRKNPGILQKIGKETDYKRGMVSLVFNKHRSSDGSIEEALTRYGAPGFAGKKPARRA